MASDGSSTGSDGALRRLRRVQRRNVGRDSPVPRGSFRPLYGRGHRSAMSLPFPARGVYAASTSA